MLTSPSTAIHRQLTPVNIITNSYDTERKQGDRRLSVEIMRAFTSTLADGSHNALWSTTNFWRTYPLRRGL